MKMCSRCCETKVEADFSALKKAKDGLHSWCRSCLAERRREDRLNRPDHYRAIEARRHERHKSARIAANKAQRLSRSDEAKAKVLAKYAERAAAYNALRRERAESDPDLRLRRAAANKEWREKNREAVCARRRDKWRQTPPSHRLRSYIGAAISRALKRGGKGGKSWQDLVGYKVGELVSHLERQFLPGMSWENYGEWHVDHIVPAKSFSYESAADQSFKDCWALTNLRPLWARLNIQKRDKRLHLL